ncbi:hypothetical protein AN216_00305, partial [Streptomyces oceani]
MIAMTRRPEQTERPDGASSADEDAAPLRLSWVQPEDLVGHELRQADEDGRDATAVRRRWQAAGGA